MNETKQLVVIGSRVLGGAVEVPGEMIKEDFWKRAILYQLIYSLFGLAAGLACILLGLVLIANGFVNEGHWSADFFGIQLRDAGPGTVLFVIGLLLPRLTAFDVRFVPPPEQPRPKQ